MGTYLQAHPASFRTSQAFGTRPGGLNPAGGHTGKDIACPIGTPVYAACDGVIEIAGNAGPWNTNRFWIEGSMAGITVALNHDVPGGGAFTYNHLSRVNVVKGQRVRRGDIIAWVGTTGVSTGPHDHFEAFPDKWNFQNGTYGRINPDIVCKEWPGTIAPASNVVAPANGRYVGKNDKVMQRDAPRVDATIVREIPAGQLEIWEGYVHGQPVTIGSFTSDIWYQDKVGYAWAGGFESQSTAGLPDLTPRAQPLAANQRRVGPANVMSRVVPKTDGLRWGDVGSNITRVITGGTVEIFTGYVHGEPIDGSDVWFVDAKGFAWSGGFEDPGVVGLPDLTVVEPPAPPVIVPEAPELGAHLNGIDVAIYQESASLNLIGADFYVIKATEGGGDWTDKALASNVAEARLSGQPVLFYHFAHPFAQSGNTAAEELRSFLKAIAPFFQLGDGVALDWEGENRHRTDWAYEWLTGAREATGATPFFYGNMLDLNRSHKDWTDATRALYNWDAVEAEFPLWFASYGKNEPGGYNPGRPPFNVTWKAGFLMWQYTSKGRLPHYDGDLDLNVFYGTTEDLRAMGGTKLLQAPVPNPPIDPPPPPVEIDPNVAKLTEFRDWLTGYIQELGTENER